MIVRPVGDGLLLITQPDHAQLARRIMEHSTGLADRPRRVSILHAIGEHDNGWADEDAAPSVDPDTGRILDFVGAPLTVRHRVWPRAVSRLAPDPWAAALVAQHAITVYDRFRADAAWTDFFAGMEGTRDALLRGTGMPLGDLVDDYAFVRLGDLVSLTFCAGWDEEQRFDPWTVRRSGARVLVVPDAFGGASIPVAVDGRVLADRPYRSDGELRSAFGVAPAMTLRGEVGGTQG